MDGVFCFGWERLEILHFDPWGKKPKKIAFYPKKMVHEVLQVSMIGIQKDHENTEIIQDFQLGNFDLLVILLYFAEYLWIDLIH